MEPVAWYQIALMVVLFMIGLVLNFVSWQWAMDAGTKQSHITMTPSDNFMIYYDVDSTISSAQTIAGTAAQLQGRLLNQ